MAKLFIVAIGLILLVSWAQSLAIYDKDVLRELRDQLRDLEEQEALAEARRAEDEKIQEVQKLEEEAPAAESIQEVPIPELAIEETPNVPIKEQFPEGVGAPDDVENLIAAETPNAKQEEGVQIPEGVGAPDDVGNCPLCSKLSVCCKTGETFACCNKIYKLEGKEIEIDENANTATYYYTNERIRIMDFRKGIVSGYEPMESACYIAAGIDFTLEDVINEAEGKEVSNVYIDPEYKKMNANPIKDVSILPYALQEKCMDKSIYWDEKVIDKTPKLLPARRWA